MATLQITRERTALYQITVTDITGAPVDLTSKSLAFQAKERLSSATPVIAKTSGGGGITISSPQTAGLAVLQIDPADTDPLPDIQVNTLVWDLKLIDGANDYQLNGGKMNVLGNVTP